MTNNKQEKSDNTKYKKLHRVKCILDEYDEKMHKCSKPLLYSYDDGNKMAETRSKAKLYRKIIGNTDMHPPWEFTSYFQGPTSTIDPSYSVTSHSRRSPIYKRRSVIPTYPSLIPSLRWNTCIETSSIESFKRDREEDRIFNCRCVNCSQKRCPSRVSVSSTLNPTFKNNIMIFTDQCTMTPRLREACCGLTPVSSSLERDVCVTESDIAVRDTEAENNEQRACPRRSQSILKRQCCSAPKNYGCHKTITVEDEAVKDTNIDDENSKPVRSRSIKSFFKLSKNKSKSRNILYNEGIDDKVMKKLSTKRIILPPPIDLHNDTSGTLIRSRYQNYVPEPIPYCHRYDSKYHMNCKQSNGPQINIDREMDEARHLVASSKIVRMNCGSRPMKQCKPTFIRLPRRVLTSENDIEAYIASSRSKVMLGGAGERKGRRCNE